MPEMYRCTKCNKCHRCGKIYYDHLEYKQREEVYVPSNKILEVDISSLRKIAQRQINGILRRMLKFKGSKERFVWQINRVIMYERGQL